MQNTLDEVRRHLAEAMRLLGELTPPPPPANVVAIKPDEVELEGRIGRPDLKTVNGKQLWTAGLGVSEGNVTQWHSIAAWGEVAEAAATVIRGQMVRVVGKQKERRYIDSEGRMQERLEITLSHIESVGSASTPSREPISATT